MKIIFKSLFKCLGCIVTTLALSKNLTAVKRFAFSAAIGLLLSFTSEAQIKHVVLDLENVLIQQIPYQNYRTFKQKSQLFQVRFDGPVLSYYIHLQAKELLAKLLERKDLTLHIASDKTRAQTLAIFDSIDPSLTKGIVNRAGKFLTSEDKTSTQFDLAKIASDPSTVVFVSHDPKKVIAAQADRILDLGPSFYKYESWEESQAAAKVAGPAKAEFFPKSQESWRFESYKLSILANLLKKPNLLMNPGTQKAGIQKDVENKIKFGTAILRGETKLISWKLTPAGNISGCESFDLLEERQLSHQTISECLESLPHTIEWRSTNSGIKDCVVSSEDGKKSTPLPIKECVSGKVKTFWKGKEQKVCAYYTDKFELITDAPNSKCSEEHLIHDPKTKKVVTVTSFPGLEKLSLKDIFDRFERKSTFRMMLKDPEKGQNMTRELGPECASAINAITDSGKSLESETLKRSIIPLSEVRFSSGQQDDSFYHWTSNPGLGATLKLPELSPKEAYRRARDEGVFESMFEFLRTRDADSYAFWRRVFYVAEDTESSRFLGNQLFEFTLNMDARTISYDYNVWLASLAEIGERYPDIKRHCRLGLRMYVPDTFGTVMFDNIFMIVAEDSKVEVIDYNQQQKWFQLLTPAPIKAIKKH